MRLKQLLGIILLAIATTTLATGSVSQLAGVRVENRDNAGVITVHANGTFTHTEFRPTDRLMLVDLAGVSVAQQDAAVHSVTAAGIQSYRVVSYRSASGAEVARIELNLMPGATVKVADIEGGVELRVTGAAHAEKNAAAAPVPVADALSHISNIAVARARDGLSIEITGSGPMTAKTMKLNHPDRLVLDIPNSTLEGRAREISVNASDIKDVRAARYQSAPPATRIVVDLAAQREFDIVPSANKLVLTVKNPAVVPQKVTTAQEPEVVAQQAATPVAQPEVKPAEPAVAAQAKPIETKTIAAKEEKPRSEGRTRADLAASHFVSADSTPVLGNQPVLTANGSLAITPELINAALKQQATAPQSQPQIQASSTPGADMATGCSTGHYNGTPFNLNLKDLDLKDFFRLISDISGLNVVLDPSVKGSLTIVLNDVPWDQALAIVLNNNGLECQLQGNVLRIATIETLRTEAEARRAQQEAQSLAVPKQTFTRYLSYAHSKDMVAVIKRFLSPRGDVVSDDRSNALIIEDIPSTLPKVDALLTSLDRKTPEVEIEARIVAATRSFARDIGTQLGFGWGNKASAVGGGSGGNSPITVTPPTGVVPAFITAPGNSALIPLFSNLAASGPTSGLSFTNFSSIYRLDFVLTMAESRGLLKILSRPRVVTQNNITALVRQGSRIPVVTAAQLGGPPTVTYTDAFLRLTVTPQITADKTIFLNVDIENTVPDFSRVTGSQLNPTLQTQQTTTQVLVNDGETITIGGVIQVNNNVAIAQVPLLGSIPLLGNLFKHSTVNTNNQELIFFITPKIIQT
jgi:type IV pilus assembly protein PilQ